MTGTVEDRHKLGWGLAALVVAGNMIGSGVYLLPATLAPVGSSSVIGWAVAGLGAVTLALVFAALGRLQPDAAGLSVSQRRGRRCAWGSPDRLGPADRRGRRHLRGGAAQSVGRCL